jgi:glucose-6-phosphate isomerase
MITFDPGNAMASRVGSEHGLSDADLDDAAKATGGLCERFRQGCEEGKIGFARLPYKELPAHDAQAFAERNAGRFRNLVQVGIGGSALGATAIHGALCDRFHNDRGTRPRYYALDHADPEETRSLLEMLDPRETLYHVVSQPRDPAGAMAGFLDALDRLQKTVGEDWTNHLVVSTDPEKGFLRGFAKEHGIQAFEIPPEVGGRFSVLSPAGLLPAAMLGVDLLDLLDGAADAHEACEEEDPRKNPGFLFALVPYLLDRARGKRQPAVMPCARALRGAADWFRELWEESLGRDPEAAAPTFATADPHARRYVEGPNDAYLLFLEVAKFREEGRVPAALPAEAPPAALQGKAYSEILSSMRSGTERALLQARRPHATLRLDEISPRSLGALFFLLEAATLYAGWLYEVDPFDPQDLEVKPPAEPPSPAARGSRYAVRITRPEES